jgi:hypothetical protein
MREDITRQESRRASIEKTYNHGIVWVKLIKGKIYNCISNVMIELRDNETKKLRVRERRIEGGNARE